MLKKCAAALLAVALFHLACAAPAFARAKGAKEARAAEKVRAGIRRLGTGEAARIKVRLRDGTRLEGYVSAAGDDAFGVTDAKTGRTTTVAYVQVAKAKGNNLSTGAKIAIGVGVALLLAAVIYFVKLNEDFSRD